MKPVWRNDRISTDTPEPNAVVIRAEDSLRAEGGFSFLVRHVESLNGKGFMPATFFFGQLVENGKIFPGEDSIAYMHAVTRGRRMFERAMRRDDLLEEAKQPGLKPATQAQKDAIVKIRRTRAFWQKGMPKKLTDEDIIKLVCKDFFCNWSNLTVEQAAKIIDHLKKHQKGFDRAINRGRRGTLKV